MPTAHFTVIALPHSLASDAGHHVSLFVSPDLVPDGSQSRLRRFRHFPKWARVLRSPGSQRTTGRCSFTAHPSAPCPPR